MEYRKLGRTEIAASAFGFGCNRIAESSAPADRREVEATLLEAFERGVNLYDTANCYDGGESEILLGKVLRAHRSQVILCSKVGAKKWSAVLHERWSDPLRFRLRSRGHQIPPSRGEGGPRRASWNFAPRFLELAIAGSLRRLGTDYIDLLYLHGPPPRVLQAPGVFEKLEDLRQRGWIRWYGVSFRTRMTTTEILTALERFPGIAVAQVLIHPRASIDLDRVAAATRGRGTAIIANQPFRKGALLADRDLEVPEGAASGRTRSQTLLRFVLQSRGVTTVLVGMRNRAHLRENLAALDAPALNEEEMRMLCSSTEIR